MPSRAAFPAIFIATATALLGPNGFSELLSLPLDALTELVAMLLEALPDWEASNVVPSNKLTTSPSGIKSSCELTGHPSWSLETSTSLKLSLGFKILGPITILGSIALCGYGGPARAGKDVPK